MLQRQEPFAPNDTGQLDRLHDDVQRGLALVAEGTQRHLERSKTRLQREADQGRGNRTADHDKDRR